METLFLLNKNKRLKYKLINKEVQYNWSLR